MCEAGRRSRARGLGGGGVFGSGFVQGQGGRAQLAGRGILGAVAPGFQDIGEGAAGIDVAVLADAQEEEAVEDALDGFVKAGAFEEIGAVVVADQVGGQLAAGFVEEIKEIGVDGAGAVGLEEPLLFGLGLGNGLAREGSDELLDGTGRDGVAG